MTRAPSSSTPPPQSPSPGVHANPNPNPNPTLTHQAYTARFKKMMAVLGEAFDAKHLTNTVTGAPRSLEFRVQVRLGLGLA